MSTLVPPLGLSVLALLAERPMHAYEMYQTLIQRAEDRLVKVRPGSLYHVVDRLAGQSLIRATGTDREGNRPERTTYDITEEGNLALTEQVAEMLATPVNEYPQFPLAMGLAHNLPKNTVLDLLERRLIGLRAELDFIETGLRDVREKAIEPKFWVDLTFQKTAVQAEIDWIGTFRADLASGTIAW
jgi:DNA-binding PadR family transcriptional regulator